MSWSDAIRDTHVDLSPEDWRYREYAQSCEAGVDRSSYAALDVPNELLTYRLQSWPTFVRHGKIAEVARVSRGIARLIRKLPEIVFAGDAGRISQAYGVFDPATLEILLAPPTGVEMTLSRGDFIDSEDGLKCLEFNCMPSLGGWDSPVIAAIQRRIPLTARFLDQLPAEPSDTNPVRILFHYVADLVRERLGASDGVVNTAFCVSPGDRVLQGSEWDRFLAREHAAVSRELGVGGEIAFCTFEQIEVGAGRASYRGRRIHAIVDLTREDLDPAVYRCFKKGNLALFNVPLGLLLTSKLNIALLCEAEEEGLLEPDEAELVRRHVPWSRRVLPGYVRYRGEKGFLPDLLIDRREELVLKEALLYGGKGVALGKSTPEGEWTELVDQSLAEGGWIVQELVESRPYLYQSGESGCCPHDVVWGPFVFGDRYAGVILRMQPKAEGRAVNLSLNATEGIVLEVPDPPADPWG